MTGYSFSAVSAAMKILSGIKLVEKQRKLFQLIILLSSKRYADSDHQYSKIKNEFMVSRLIKDLPATIEICTNNAENSKNIPNTKRLLSTNSYIKLNF